MTGRLGQAARWARQGLLTVGAVLGVVCILGTLGAALFGLRPLVFESGSMSPTIKTGDLAISRSVDASSLEKGDIVSVPTGTGSRVTHRVVSVERVGSDAILRLRGDANSTTDAAPYRVSQADRVLFHVPRLGYLVGWLSGPTGLFLLGLYAAFLLSVLFRRSPEAAPAGPASATPLGAEMRVIPPSARAGRRKGSRKNRKPKMLTGGLSVVLALGLAGGVLFERTVTPTLAAWTDGVEVTGTNLGAYTVPAPVISGCVNTPTGSPSLRHVTLTWPAQTSPVPLAYAVSVDVDPAASATVTDVAPNKQVDIAYDPASTIYQNKRITVSLAGYPSGSPSWKSPVDTWQFQTASNTGQPICGEKTAPTVAFTAPDTTTRTAAAEITYVGSNSGCKNNSRPACGTMADASTITNVDYILQRVQSGTTTCWDGSAYVAGCGYRAATIANQTTWQLTGANTTAYASPGGTFTLTVRVTDMWGNATTMSRTFTVTP